MFYFIVYFVMIQKSIMFMKLNIRVMISFKKSLIKSKAKSKWKTRPDTRHSSGGQLSRGRSCKNHSPLKMSWTDRPIDGQTDTASSRVARTWDWTIYNCNCNNWDKTPCITGKQHSSCGRVGGSGIAKKKLTFGFGYRRADERTDLPTQKILGPWFRD